MKTLTRNMLLLFWLSITTVVLTACGGGDDPSDDAAPAPPPAPFVANAAAHAGLDRDGSINQSISLDGSGSTDPDGDNLTYTWTQTNGPDVTGGSGKLTGISPGFNAPGKVSTLRFELRVNDGHGDSPADVVQINIMENAAHALFVDGNNGSDSSGNGSRGNPYASIHNALTHITPEQEDIYVMSLNDTKQRYDESEATLEIPDGTSLYGGFGNDWLRDVKQTPTRLLGATMALRISTISTRAWFSGFDLKTVDGINPADTLAAIVAQHGTNGILTIEDNIIHTGHASVIPSLTPGSNYGVLASHLAGLEVYRNTLTIGNAANGSIGADGNPGIDGADAGGRAGFLGDAGGDNGGPGNAGKGGDGGNGDTGPGASFENGDDATGARGGKGGHNNAAGYADSGKSGTAGSGGSSGGNGPQLGGFGSIGYNPANGGNGGDGQYGGNGGGGRGGSANLLLDGGGGGAGGGGGDGGKAGLKGIGGGASIGIYTYAISGQTNLYDNTITTGNGGQAGDGGHGGKGGKGGDGSDGNNGECTACGGAFETQAGGGGGGAGGTGGSGGGGGGGGTGGPSFAVLIGTGITAFINNNHLNSANGGDGGRGGELGLLGLAGAEGNGGIGFTGIGNGSVGEPGKTGHYGQTGAGGHGGWSYAVFDADPEDGLVPSLSNNTLGFGQAGNAGAPPGMGGQVGEANFSY